MGACSSSDNSQSSSPEERTRSAQIGKELKKDRSNLNEIKKILFLGSGGSGKTTVFKQLRQIHGDGWSESDRLDFVRHIHAQIVREMQKAVTVYIEWHQRQEQKQRNKDGDSAEEYDELSLYDDINLESRAMSEQCLALAAELRAFSHNKRKAGLDANIIKCVQELWQEPVIREIYDKRNITKIETSSCFFWDMLETVTDASYLPSQQDIMLCRFKTTGLHEMQLMIENDRFVIIDVGGQKSNRRKWVHCFEFVVAVIFICSLTAYDEVLHEDVTINAMEDQIELFENICNNDVLSRTAMILFLNKKDLFQQKHCVNHVPLNLCPRFAKYDKDCFDYWDGVGYITKQFTDLNKFPTQREVFTHITCATDTNNVEKVFSDVQLVVITSALSEGGYMAMDIDEI